MKDLVKLAERREAACKEEIARLLASRSAMYESNAAAAAATADQATELGASTGDEADSVEVTHRIDTAEKRMMVAQVGMLCSNWLAAVPRCENHALPTD